MSRHPRHVLSPPPNRFPPTITFLRANAHLVFLNSRIFMSSSSCPFPLLTSNPHSPHTHLPFPAHPPFPPRVLGSPLVVPLYHPTIYTTSFPSLLTLPLCRETTWMRFPFRLRGPFSTTSSVADSEPSPCGQPIEGFSGPIPFPIVFSFSLQESPPPQRPPVHLLLLCLAAASNPSEAPLTLPLGATTTPFVQTLGNVFFGVICRNNSCFLSSLFNRRNLFPVLIFSCSRSRRAIRQMQLVSPFPRCTALFSADFLSELQSATWLQSVLVLPPL